MRFNRGINKSVIRLLVVVSGFLMTACFKDYMELDKLKEYKWEPAFAIPLVNSTFDFEDFIREASADSLFVSGDDDVITFIYEDTVISKKASSLFNLYDQSFSNSEIIPPVLTGQIVPLGSVVYSNRMEFSYQENADQSLDSILLKDGALDINMNWNFNEGAKLDIVFKSVIMPTDTLRLTYEFPTNSGASFSSSTNLANAKIDLTNEGTTSSTFVVDITWTIYSDGNPMPDPSFFNVDIILANPKFSGLFGNLGSQAFQTSPKTKPLTTFDNFSSGVFELEEPTIKLALHSSFGIGASIDLSNIRIDNNAGTSKITGSIVSTPAVIGGVSVNQIGMTKTTVVEINKDNSNIVDLISKIPKEITFSFNGTLLDNSMYNFALDTNAIDVDLSLELPLIGRVSGLSTSEVYDFNGSDLEKVDNLLFQIQIVNQFPIEAEIQTYFLDDNGIILDSLFVDDREILPSSINLIDGSVFSPGQKTTVVAMDATGIKNIVNSASIRITATMNTTEEGTTVVKILNSHTIQIALGIQTKFSIN